MTETLDSHEFWCVVTPVTKKQATAHRHGGQRLRIWAISLGQFNNFSDTVSVVWENITHVRNT